MYILYSLFFTARMLSENPGWSMVPSILRRCYINLVAPQRLIQASWHSAYTNFVAVVDVDAGGGRDVIAHWLAHEVVVIGVIRTAWLLRHHLVDVSEGTVAVT